MFVNSRIDKKKNSDQQIVIFPLNRNRKRFAEPGVIQIGIGIVCEFQNLRMGKGKVFVRWAVFANYSRIPKINLFTEFVFSNFFFLILIYFYLKNLHGKHSRSKLYAFFLYIFNIKIRYS